MTLYYMQLHLKLVYASAAARWCKCVYVLQMFFLLSAFFSVRPNNSA